MLELKGKKVLVVGLGKSGMAAALFLRHHGAAHRGGHPWYGWPYSFGGYWGPAIIFRGGVHYGGHGVHYR